MRSACSIPAGKLDTMRLSELCREPTQPYGPGDESTDSPRPCPSSGATLFDPLPSPMSDPDEGPCGCEEAGGLKSKLESQGTMLEECANTLAIAGYGDLAWKAHAMRKATRP